MTQMLRGWVKLVVSLITLTTFNIIYIIQLVKGINDQHPLVNNLKFAWGSCQSCFWKIYIIKTIPQGQLRASWRNLHFPVLHCISPHSLLRENLLHLTIWRVDWGSIIYRYWVVVLDWTHCKKSGSNFWCNFKSPKIFEEQRY